MLAPSYLVDMLSWGVGGSAWKGWAMDVLLESIRHWSEACSSLQHPSSRRSAPRPRPCSLRGTPTSLGDSSGSQMNLLNEEPSTAEMAGERDCCAYFLDLWAGCPELARPRDLFRCLLRGPGRLSFLSFLWPFLPLPPTHLPPPL